MSLFDISNLQTRLKDLEKQTMEEGFWSDTKNSTKILDKIKTIKNKTTEYEKIKNEIYNLLELTELVKVENDEEIAKDILKNTTNLQ